MIVLNLFVAVILEGFNKTMKDENSQVKSIEIENFNAVWRQFDQEANGYIYANSLKKFISSLERPLGWKDGCFVTDKRKNLIIANLMFPLYTLNKAEINQPVFFYYDILEGLSKFSMIQHFGLIE